MQVTELISRKGPIINDQDKKYCDFARCRPSGFCTVLSTGVVDKWGTFPEFVVIGHVIKGGTLVSNCKDWVPNLSATWCERLSS